MEQLTLMSIITIPSDVISAVSTAWDDIFNSSKKLCRIIYPPKALACANCVVDPIGQKPGFTYRHGGPMPFPNGMACPVCTGTGYRAESAEGEIYLMIRWQPRDINLEIDGVILPFGIIKAIGYMTDLRSLMNADYILVQTPIEGYIEGKYKRFREPFDENNLIKNRFFSTYLKRIG